MRTIEKKSLKVGKYVNTEHVDTLIRNYKKDRWLHNSERIQKEDSIGVWLSAEELEEFVQTAKMNGADGIRLYFGVYGKNGRLPEFEGLQTVAFVATTSEAGDTDNQGHKDIYVERDGETSILAYNTVWPLTGPTKPPGGGGSIITMGTTVGEMMVADKEKGLQVI